MSPLTGLYAVAIFLGSLLLFLVEPMAAKRLLPLLGGSAAVWTTCLVFFQVTLLLGYLCAHWLATRLRPRAQALVYTLLLMACLAQVGFNLFPELRASTVHPIVSVFVLLTTLIGLPFIVLSATNPLLQAWYAKGFSNPASGQGEQAVSPGIVPPYRLFALSNFGSLLALVIYPWLIEPKFSLREQSIAWLEGFAVFASACAGIAWFKLRKAGESGAATQAAVDDPSAGQRATPSMRVLWLLLAACGSILLCAMTNHLSQNIAAIPLLWIVPLTMYLLSFVIAFSRGSWLPGFLRFQIPVVGVSVARMILLGLTAVSLAGIAYMLNSEGTDLSLAASIPFYSSVLLVLCLFCHAELHRLRPAPAEATAFYLMIAAGGALGSIFVGIVAPMVFSASYELACGLALTAMLAIAVTGKNGMGWRIFWSVASIALVVLPVLQARRERKETISQTRNFYGTLRVTQEMEEPFKGPTRTLVHGTIRHGTQILTDDLRNTPTTYYAHDSGVGLALDFCCRQRPRRVGVIGLGTGTLAAYGRKGDVFRFYDINPQVEVIANRYFSYLRESPASTEVIPGDARLALASEPPQHYDVLVIDAFSGDAIPVHLLTRQALELYRRHLQPGGIIAFHVSSQFLDLTPVVRQQADEAGLRAVLVQSEDDEEGTGAYAADWVLVTANEDFLARSEVQEAGTEAHNKPGLRLWTDDYNSVLPLMRWRDKDKEDKDKEKEAEPAK